MPRKLLRVALVAAIFPVVLPVNLPAQSGKMGSTVRTTVPAQEPKKGLAGWWQKVRGQKPSSAPSKVVKVSIDREPSAEVEANPFELEGPTQQKVAQTSIRPARRRPTFAEFEGQNTVATPVPETHQDVPSAATEAFESPRQASTTTHNTSVTANDFADPAANPFPDDQVTTPRGHRTGRRTEQVRPVAGETQPRATSARGRVESGFEFDDIATPVAEEVSGGNADPTEGADAPEAFPIEEALPPLEMDAGYEASPGNRGSYERTAMQSSPNNDVRFARPQGTQGVPAQPASNAVNHPPMYGSPPGYVQSGPYEVGAPVGVARLDGTLYPSPRPDIPGYVGSTMITNPALDPHEMLYAHRYRGLYGPFYHKTERFWVMTPFGISKHEKRTLMGTEVRVNYKSHISPFSLFFPPVTH